VRVEECRVYLENPTDKKVPEKQFVFDSAYDGSSSNESIYGDICYSLVESVLEGYNATIFAYGQTGNYAIFFVDFNYSIFLKF
jgi:kinesin family protein 3/17